MASWVSKSNRIIVGVRIAVPILGVGGVGNKGIGADEAGNAG
jgi:hypothetical protein